MGRLGLAGLVLAAAIGGAGCAPSPTTPDSPTGPGIPAPETTPTPAPTPTPWPAPYPEHERAKTYVLMHIWYISGEASCPTTGNPLKYWTSWIWQPKIDDPCKTIPGAPWMRQISSVAYPLTGPYDSRNEEILRWQIRQAKAAGIDCFFIPLYTWSPNLKYLHDVFFGNDSRKGMLQIAQEENFHFGFEKWKIENKDLPTYGQAWKDDIADSIAEVEASPYKDAYIHIGGKPAVWLISPGYMKEKEMVAFLDGTADKPISVSWILRTMPLEQVIAMNTKLKRSKIEFEADYARPSTESWVTNPDFKQDLSYVALHPELGIEPIAHEYAGYDERGGELAGPYYGRFGWRNGTGHMTEVLEKSVEYGAKTILIESWNEWGEGSTIEAGLNVSAYRDFGQEPDLYRDSLGQDTPYKYLDALRKFNGMQEWVNPQPPPCSAIDSKMREYQKELPEYLQCIPDTAAEKM